MQERKNYALKKFADFVGRDKLEEAIIAAWKSFKPNFDKISANAI